MSTQNPLEKIIEILETAEGHRNDFLGVNDGTGTGEYFSEVLAEAGTAREQLQRHPDIFLLKRGITPKMNFEDVGAEISRNGLTAKQAEDIASGALLLGQAYHFARKGFTTTYDRGTLDGQEAGPSHALQLLNTIFDALNVFPSFTSDINAQSAKFLESICGVMSGNKETLVQPTMMQAVSGIMPAITEYYRRERSKIPLGSAKTHQEHEGELEKLNASYFGLLNKFLGYVNSALNARTPPTIAGFEKFSGMEIQSHDKSYKPMTQEYMLGLRTRNPQNKREKEGDAEYRARLLEVVTSECGPPYMIRYHSNRDTGVARVTVIFGDGNPQNNREAGLSYNKGGITRQEKDLLLAMCDHILAESKDQTAIKTTQKARADMYSHL